MVIIHNNISYVYRLNIKRGIKRQEVLFLISKKKKKKSNLKGDRLFSFLRKFSGIMLIFSHYIILFLGSFSLKYLFSFEVIYSPTKLFCDVSYRMLKNDLLFLYENFLHFYRFITCWTIMGNCWTSLAVVILYFVLTLKILSF